MVGRAGVEQGADRVSVPLVILSAILCGLGLLGTFFWLLTFNWLLFPSLAVVALGCYLLFSRATGPDHA